MDVEFLIGRHYTVHMQHIRTGDLNQSKGRCQWHTTPIVVVQHNTDPISTRIGYEATGSSGRAAGADFGSCKRLVHGASRRWRRGYQLRAGPQCSARGGMGSPVLWVAARFKLLNSIQVTSTTGNAMNA
jgi:hypothetical protein